jgi:hypothetical protein
MTTERKHAHEAADQLIGAAQALELAARRLRHEAKSIRAGERVYGWQAQPGYRAHVEGSSNTVFHAHTEALAELGVSR